MNILSNPLYIIGGLAVLLVIFIWSLYNGLVSLREAIEEAFSQIDVQLKRRAELIPNLVETVKGYAKHEKTVFTEVTQARTALMGAKNIESKAKADNMLTEALGKLFAVAENYPQLKANENFIHLQKELSDTEDKVAYSRQYYNNVVRDYNIKVQQFPAVLIARQMGFDQKEFFEAGEEERKGVKVKFD